MRQMETVSEGSFEPYQLSVWIVKYLMGIDPMFLADRARDFALAGL